MSLPLLIRNRNELCASCIASDENLNEKIYEKHFVNCKGWTNKAVIECGNWWQKSFFFFFFFLKIFRTRSESPHSGVVILSLWGRLNQHSVNTLSGEGIMLLAYVSENLEALYALTWQQDILLPVPWLSGTKGLLRAVLLSCRPARLSRVPAATP